MLQREFAKRSVGTGTRPRVLHNDRSRPARPASSLDMSTILHLTKQLTHAYIEASKYSEPGRRTWFALPLLIVIATYHFIVIGLFSRKKYQRV